MNKIRHINIIQETEYTVNNKINKNMMILEKIIFFFQIWNNYDEKILVTTFDCRLKGVM
jgi:hypothetical protein